MRGCGSSGLTLLAMRSRHSGRPRRSASPGSSRVTRLAVADPISSRTGGDGCTRPHCGPQPPGGAQGWGPGDGSACADCGTTGPRREVARHACRADRDAGLATPPATRPPPGTPRARPSHTGRARRVGGGRRRGSIRRRRLRRPRLGPTGRRGRCAFYRNPKIKILRNAPSGPRLGVS